MAKLITETTFNISSKVDRDKSCYVEGVFSTAEVKNRNGRIYKKHILEREVSKLKELMQEGSLIGELNHPTYPDLNPERAAILIKELYWEGNDLIGKAKVTSNTIGRDVQALINDGVRLGISSRGLGTVNESSKYVNEDFDLLTFDLVSSPSNSTSFINGIYEGKEFNIKDDIDYELQLKEAKEQYTKKLWTVLENIKSQLPTTLKGSGL